MNIFVSAIYAIACLLTGALVIPANAPVNSVPDLHVSKVSTAQFSFVDEEPIVMRSRIKTTGGIALPGVSVSLTPAGESEPTFSGITDELGECEFDSVPVGNYLLNLSKSGYVPVQVELALAVNTSRTDTLELQH